MNQKAGEWSDAIKAREDVASKLILKSWANDDFRRELMANPKSVLSKELGQEIPDRFQIEVVEETGKDVFFVLPRKPEAAQATGALSDEALQSVAGGIGFYVKYDPPVKDANGNLISTGGRTVLFWA